MSFYETDVAIIGAGPAGLFSIFECGMLKLKCHVIDVLSEVGGQCIALYPEKPIYDIPAHPRILAADLIDHLKSQAEPFHPHYHLNQQVESLQPTAGERWELKTSTGTVINAKAVIIAAGVGAFGPNRPPLEGIESYEDKSVFYFVKNKEMCRNKKVVIAGGGDSAVDWALALQDVGAKVSVVHRRHKFRAAPETVSKVEALAEAGVLDLVIPYQLAGLEGSNGNLEAVVVETLEGERKSIEADILLPFFGLSMNLGPIAEWGLNLDRHHITVNQATSQTSTSGIFAIGDISTYDHKLKLILTGFAEAAQAAHAIRKLVYPDQAFHFEYSTTQGVPGK
jgi:thioredoxin reductase (NADPH)